MEHTALLQIILPYLCKTLHDFESILMCYLGDDISKIAVQESNHRVKKTNGSSYEQKTLKTDFTKINIHDPYPQDC